MSTREREVPKVFVSYSWTSPAHEDWVLDLAHRLKSDGVEVIIDKWRLKEGHDTYNFMEEMVKSPEVKRVLIILDKRYCEKANKRSGGVGTETQIISPKIYKDVVQEKFIPVISEKDENGEPFIPVYLDGRKYIDMSEDEKFEDGYESLLRNLFDRPQYREPETGTPPSYLFEDTPMSFRTKNLVRGFDAQINRNARSLDSLIRGFLEHFTEDLSKFSVNTSDRSTDGIGKAIHDSIISYTPLRDDYVSFLDKVLKWADEFDYDLYIRFFERIHILLSPQDERSSWYEYEFDNFRFIIHELFIYNIAVALKNERYKFLSELIYSSYFIQVNNQIKKEPEGFYSMYHYIDTMDPYYKKTYDKNFYSPMADLITKRISPGLTVIQVVEADLLLYYVAVLLKHSWFPCTYIYKRKTPFELFDKLISLKHFDRVKVIFNVDTPLELKSKIEESKEYSGKSMQGYSESFDRINPLHVLVNVDLIGTVR